MLPLEWRKNSKNPPRQAERRMLNANWGFSFRRIFSPCSALKTTQCESQLSVSGFCSWWSTACVASCTELLSPLYQITQTSNGLTPWAFVIVVDCSVSTSLSSNLWFLHGWNQPTHCYKNTERHDYICVWVCCFFWV